MRIEARQWWFDVRRRLRGQSLSRAARLVRVLLPALADARRRTIVLVVVVGVGVGCLASALAWLVRTTEHGRVAWLSSLPYWAQCVAILCLPVVGAVVVGSAVRRLAPSTAGSGVPLVKAAYHLKAGELDGRSVWARLVFTTLSIGSGLSLGREGPSVHLGASFGSWIGQRLAIERARIKMLSAVGAACGVAAAFNAPIAAIMFVMEEIVNDLRHALVGALVVAVVLASATALAIAGDQPLLGEETHGFLSAELLAYAPLGVAAGLAGRAFVWMVLWARASLGVHLGYRAALERFALGGLATGLVTLVVFVITGLPVLGASGVDAIAPLLTLGLPVLTLVLLCVGKMVATSASFMTGAPGGLFGPTLFIGAMLGALVAGGVNEVAALVPWMGSIDVGAMAVVGMAAFFGGVARCPMTAAMIVVEITDDYALVLPLMLATTLSVVLVQSRYRGSIYDLLLAQDGIVVHTHAHHELLNNTTVAEVMTHEVHELSGGMTVEDALAHVDRSQSHRLYVVVGADDQMAGVVSPTDLVWEVARGAGAMTLDDFVLGRRIVHCHPDQDLDSVLEKITHFEFTEFPVVPRDDERRVIGFVGLHEITLLRQQLGR